MTTMTECPDCHGDGYISEPIRYTSAPIQYDTIEHRCGWCLGSGQVEADDHNAGSPAKPLEAA